MFMPAVYQTNQVAASGNKTGSEVCKFSIENFLCCY